MNEQTKTKISEQTREELDVFCRNVKTLRERHGLSKKEMAKILGVGVESLTKIEQGIIPRRASVSIVIKLAQHCNIEPHKLFTLL